MDNMKKAAKMLLNGATLLKDPCPYCNGVRVMKEGNALCVTCGKEPQEKNIKKESNLYNEQKNNVVVILYKKLIELSKELETEKEHEKQLKLLVLIERMTSILSGFK